MSANQTANDQKAALFNLIKNDDFYFLPNWYQQFVPMLMHVSSAKTPTAIYMRVDKLNGFIFCLMACDIIRASEARNLEDLVLAAQNFVLLPLLNKAA